MKEQLILKCLMNLDPSQVFGSFLVFHLSEILSVYCGDSQAVEVEDSKFNSLSLEFLFDCSIGSFPKLSLFGNIAREIQGCWDPPRHVGF